ncbi:hypothetical protein LAZ67_1000758 [Cordylochernes scorpioides]|uniref:Uncharacterized protein n=1 Tax=Cordylochernes scorpioides TaxID=51811 RepID=A0ABY6JVM4_9ARAC|nr:hypothetical protein LAZ67_1000758 [Cordylochernes scorpioides]
MWPTCTQARVQDGLIRPFPVVKPLTYGACLDSTSTKPDSSMPMGKPQAHATNPAETLTFLEYVALDEGLEICGSPELEEKKKEEEETEDDEVKEEIMMPTRGEVIAAHETLQKLSKTSADIDVHFEDDLDKIRWELIVAVYACGVDVEKGPIQQQLWNAPPCDNVESCPISRLISRPPDLQCGSSAKAG